MYLFSFILFKNKDIFKSINYVYQIKLWNYVKILINIYIYVNTSGQYSSFNGYTVVF